MTKKFKAFLLLPALICTGCSHSYGGVFTIRPLHASGVYLDDATEAKVTSVVSSIVRSYGMEPVDWAEGARPEMPEYDVLASFVLVRRGPGERALHVTVLRPRGVDALRVTIRDLGNEKETEQVRRLRKELGEALGERLSGFDVEFESGKVDAWFAP